MVINGIEVDIESLYSIEHRCVPGTCGKKRCCCSQYEISVSDRELTRIIGYLPETARYADSIGSGSEYENYFEEEGPDLHIIDMQDDGLCTFAYCNERRHILCSLHSVALELGLPPHRVKPESCFTWPLAISEEKPVVLSIADDAFAFPCNTERRGEKRSLHSNIAGIVRNLYGDAFLRSIEGSNA